MERDGYLDAGVTWSQENLDWTPCYMRKYESGTEKMSPRVYWQKIDVTLGSLGEMSVDLETNGDQ